MICFILNENNNNFGYFVEGTVRGQRWKQEEQLTQKKMAAQTEEVAGDMVGHTKTEEYLRWSRQGSQLIGYSSLRERVLVFQLWATDRPK